MQQQIVKAHKIDDIFNTVLNKALTVDEINNFYCEADDARGPLSARFQLSTLIKINSSSARNAHILFVGYRGCGKSTELNHLQKDIQPQIVVLNYSVMRELDPQSINYIELFIVTMEKLFSLVTSMDLAIDDNFIKRVVNWTQTKEINEIKEKHFSLQAEAGINAKFGIPYLKEFFLKLKGAAKTSSSFKETLKNTLEPRLSDLIQYCNDLITEIRMQLIETGYKDLVIFIEDLDKIPLKKAQDLFNDYANQLTLLKATVIYTFPVSLYYNSTFGAIRNYFSDIIELPMVKIRQKDETEYAHGIDVLKNIVHTRIDAALFENDAILHQMVLMTGGVIRDLFTMISDAAFIALSKGETAISNQGYLYAYGQLKKEYDNIIADHMDNGTVKYKAEEQYLLMTALINDEKKKPINTEMMLLLRQYQCVLSYNGEGWCDVHPIMKDVLKERGYIA